MQELELSAGTVGIIGPISNSGLVELGGGRALIVDTQSGEGASAHLARMVADRGFTSAVVVNTHYHWDHTSGNSGFAGYEILSTRFTRDTLKAAGSSYWGPSHEYGANDSAGAALSGLPHLVIDAGSRIVVTGPERSVEITAVGRPAHTGGDLVVRVGDEVLFLGDLWFNGIHPALDPSGDLTGWIDVLERLQASSPRVLLGGHGPAGGPADLGPMLDYLRDIANLADPSDHPPRADWHRPERHEQLLARLAGDRAS